MKNIYVYTYKRCRIWEWTLYLGALILLLCICVCVGEMLVLRFVDSGLLTEWTKNTTLPGVATEKEPEKIEYKLQNKQAKRGGKKSHRNDTS